MKKLIITLALILITLSADAVGFKFGIKLGATFSKVENSNGLSDGTINSKRELPFLDKNVTGFTGGVAAKIDIIKGFGIDPEVMFQQISGKMEMRAVADDDNTGKYRVSTLSIPLMLRYRLDLPVISPMVFTGPVFGFRLQSGYSYALSPTSVQTDWRIGLGAMIKGKTEIAFSYNHGLNNFTKYKDGYRHIELENKATYWTVTLGYFF